MRPSINYKQPFIILFVFFITAQCNAQIDSNWVLKFTKKSSTFNPRKNDFQPSSKGFYFYENCIYTLLLKNNKEYYAFVRKIKKDSLLFTGNYLNPSFVTRALKEDTLTISPNEIKVIRVFGSGLLSSYGDISTKNYGFNFEKSDKAKRMKIDTISNLGYTYEVVNSITATGISKNYLALTSPYKNDSLVSYKIDSSKFKKRNYIWLSPMPAKEINGLSIGIATGNSLFSDMPIKINGLNINADILSGLAGIMSIPYSFTEVNMKRFNDTIVLDGKNIINGLSISAGGVIEGKRFNGFFINGGLCQSDKGSGIFVAGVRNMFQDMKGISIAGLRNDALKCNGIQIGLINVCKHLKGIQIGLWNVNSKRKLPFINWGA